MTESTIQSLTKPQHILSLATSSMLVAVEVSVWTATKQDREISDEVTAAKHADRNAGRFVKHILGNDPDHKRVLNYRQTIYNWLQRRTYPWSTTQQLLPVIDLTKFMQEYNDHEAAFNGLVETFLQKLPGIISTMAFQQSGMGTMFRREDYPSVEELRTKFRMRLFTAPVPEGDYRCQISQDLAEDLHNNYCRQAEQALGEVLTKQISQLTAVMESLSHCCGVETVQDVKTGETKTKRRKIYDTTVQKAVELCETFKQFNLTSSPQLEEARASLENVLTGINVTALKDSDSLREQVKRGVDDILSKFRPAEVAVCDTQLPHDADTTLIAEEEADEELASEMDVRSAETEEQFTAEPEQVSVPPTQVEPEIEEEEEEDIRSIIAKYTKS